MFHESSGVFGVTCLLVYLVLGPFSPALCFFQDRRASELVPSEGRMSEPICYEPLATDQLTTISAISR